MRKYAVLLSTLSWAQIIHYTENFNGGTPPGWTLNSSDLGSNPNPFNRWVVDAPYTAAHTQTAANPAFCQLNDPSFCQSVSGPAVPAQPSGISGSPQSPFMYISFNPTWNGANCPTAPSLTPILYIEPTSIFPCYPVQSSFARSGAIPIPPGTQPIKVSFFWLCQGGPNAYGQVYYSTNGTTWTQVSSRNGSSFFRNQPSWYADTISLSLSRPATLYLGFQFVNNPGGGGMEPPFGIDEVVVWEESGSSPTTSITLSPPVSMMCAGSGLSVSFSTSGTFSPTNTFQVELSDAAGSFANPTVIGTGTSSPIACLVPSNIPSGSYRVRVTSTSPVAVSNDEPIQVISLGGLTCSASPNPATPGSLVTFTLGGTGLPSGPFTILWDPDDGSGQRTNSAASLPTNLTHTYNTQGGYAVSFRVTHNASGCFNDCAVPLMIDPSGFLPIISYEGGYLSVRGLLLGQEVEVYDLTGRLLYKGEGNISLPFPPYAVYILKVRDDGGIKIVRGVTP
ncbi:MAG: PKD domain-containing protein [Bacteroidia bacterium]|nr:PKD domain-containing protein [Bacteroidia bacterium]MDW8134917.1 PKD domain-containing protein [Bacteroidia bacterium]